MANLWPIASGNWSNSTIWSGSLIPTAADDVFLNSQSINLDQTIVVRSINNTATGSAIAGGLLNIYSDHDIAVTPTGINSSGQVVIGGFIKYYNTGSITIIATFLQTWNTLENVNTGTINIQGEVRLPNINISSGRTITNSSTGTINIIGSITCPGTTTSTNHGVLNSQNGQINIIGNITAGNNGGNPHGVVNNLNGVINVTGNVFGGTASTAYGILNSAGGIINITGNVTGGPASTNTHGINNAGVGIVNVTGTVAGGNGSAAHGISSTAAGVINIIGQLQAAPIANAVVSTSTTATNIFTVPLISSGSYNAIYCYNVQLYDDISTRYVVGVSGSTSTIAMISPNQVTGVPSGSHVRANIVYGPGNELTGSMSVPHPNAVSYGVAVDNTTGTAIVKPEDVWNIAVTSLTSSNSIGQRLANTITTASMQGIVDAFN